MRQLLPGLLLAGVVGLCGEGLDRAFPGFGGVTLAVLLGLVFGNLFPLSPAFGAGLRFAEKYLLEISIVLLGFGLEAEGLVKLGAAAMVAMGVVVAATVFWGPALGRLLGLSGPFARLISMGSAVCGASAIAVAAPLVGGDDEEIGLSVSIVNVLGAAGIFILPALAHVFFWTSQQRALIVGGSLPGVGHVVGAGFALGDEVGNLSTVMKMGRILFLGPIALLLAWSTKSHLPAADKRFPLPLFIMGFFVTALLTGMGFVPKELGAACQGLATSLLAISMGAIGLRIRISTLRRQGPRAVGFAALLLSAQVVALWGLSYWV